MAFDKDWTLIPCCPLMYKFYNIPGPCNTQGFGLHCFSPCPSWLCLGWSHNLGPGYGYNTDPGNTAPARSPLFTFTARCVTLIESVLRPLKDQSPGHEFQFYCGKHLGRCISVADGVAPSLWARGSCFFWLLVGREGTVPCSYPYAFPPQKFNFLLVSLLPPKSYLERLLFLLQQSSPKHAIPICHDYLLSHVITTTIVIMFTIYGIFIMGQVLF